MVACFDNPYEYKGTYINSACAKKLLNKNIKIVTTDKPVYKALKQNIGQAFYQIKGTQD
jgi:hypothetical protein